MAKKFVRGITDIKTITNQDFDTNNVNDLLSDGEHNYIHRKKGKSEEYHNLTDNLKTVSSDNTDLLTVTNDNKTTNSATLHPQHDSQKEQSIESTRNTITIEHGDNATSETTKVDTNPQVVLEHGKLTSSDGGLTFSHIEASETTDVSLSTNFKQNNVAALTTSDTSGGTSLISIETGIPDYYGNSFIINQTSLTNKINSIVDSIENYQERIKLNVGTGQTYSTIQEALDTINDSSVNKVYDIICHEGNHYFTMMNSKLPDYVNIVGSTGCYEDVVIIGELPNNSDDNTISQTSTFNVSKNNNFENVTITARNMRYTIHDESAGVDKDWCRRVTNCHIVHYGNNDVYTYRQGIGESTSGLWINTRAWGEGGSSGSKSYFNNVIFESPVQPYYIHEPLAPDSTEPYLKLFSNCVFKTTKDEYKGYGGGFTVDNNTQRANGKNTIILNNCSFQRAKIKIDGDVPIDIRVYGSNTTPIQVSNIVNFPKTDKTMLFYYDGNDPLTGFEQLTIDTSKGYEYVIKATQSTPANELVGVNVSGAVVKGQTVMTSNDKYIYNGNQLIIN